jgi:hypothetical protein
MSDKVEKVLGHIKCLEVKELDDGSAYVTFDADPEFINNYLETFNLEEWDQKHFEKTIQDAISASVLKVKSEKGE